MELARSIVLVFGAALAGLAVSTAGLVSFVALIARRLTGTTGQFHLPAALVGSLVVVVADMAGAHLLGARQGPVGVLNAAIGAP